MSPFLHTLTDRCITITKRKVDPACNIHACMHVSRIVITSALRQVFSVLMFVIVVLYGIDTLVGKVLMGTSFHIVTTYNVVNTTKRI